MFDMTGKVCVITGATKGIGRAIAEQMAKAGGRVVISSRDEGRCNDVASAIKDAGGEAFVIPCNIGHKDQLQGLVDGAVKEWGQIDVLVCNAAVNPYFGPLREIPDDAFQAIMQRNVQSNLWLCNMAIPQMAERKDGAVIIVSSIGGLRGETLLGAYGISKAADLAIARNLAFEYGPDKIRVNAIAPGLVRTDFARALWEDKERVKQQNAKTPLGRLGEPDEIAGVAVMLASNAGSYVSG